MVKRFVQSHWDSENDEITFVKDMRWDSGFRLNSLVIFIPKYTDGQRDCNPATFVMWDTQSKVSNIRFIINCLFDSVK